MKSLGFILLSLFAINSYAQSIHDRLIPPLVGAHQGGNPWEGGNNTIPKFNQAIKQGADIVEMDLQTTADGVVIVFHDAKLDNRTRCSGVVSETPYAKIQNCRYNNGSKIETFEDVIVNIDGRAVINAEFKTMQAVVPAIRLVEKYNAYAWIYFQTKAEREKYQLAREADSKVALLFKAKNVSELDWILSQDDPNLIVIEMEKEMATPENIQKVHNLYKLVSVNSWRYGSLEEFFSAACDKVYKSGVDIAIANNIKSCVKQRNDRIN